MYFQFETTVPTDNTHVPKTELDAHYDCWLPTVSVLNPVVPRPASKG